jgi:hypothetical protein
LGQLRLEQRLFFLKRHARDSDFALLEVVIIHLLTNRTVEQRRHQGGEHLGLHRRGHKVGIEVHMDRRIVHILCHPRPPRMRL